MFSIVSQVSQVWLEELLLEQRRRVLKIAYFWHRLEMKIHAGTFKVSRKKICPHLIEKRWENCHDSNVRTLNAFLDNFVVSSLPTETKNIRKFVFLYFQRKVYLSMWRIVKEISELSIKIESSIYRYERIRYNKFFEGTIKNIFLNLRV